MTPFIVTVWLLVPSSTGAPLKAELPPPVALHAASLAECEAIHATRIVAEREKKHAREVAAVKGRVVAECREAK